MLNSTKYLFLLWILSGSLGTYAQTQDWVLANPLPQANSLHSVIAIPGTDNIAAVGDQGTFMMSSDQGATWYVQHKIGAVDRVLIDVVFTDSLIGYAVSRNSGFILKTVDGGVNWILMNTGPCDEYYSIVSPNQNTIYALGRSYVQSTHKFYLVRTTDAGNSWTTDTIPISNFGQMIFLNDSVGYLVGASGQIAKTIDKGITWTPQISGTTDNLNSIYFLNDSIGFVVGDNGIILKTSDSGNNWIIKDSIVGTSNPYGLDDIDDIYFVNPDTGIVTGRYVRLKTEDGGNIWFAQDLNVPAGQNSICFVSEQIGFIVGSTGIVLKTTDVGDTWEYIVGSEIWLYDLECTSTTCIAVGSERYLLRSNDLGETWVVDSMVAQKYLDAIHFVNDSLGFIGGGYSNLLKTTNGGNTWDSIYIGTNDTIHIRDIYFINDSIGFITGAKEYTGFFGQEYKGIILRTIDGGNSWVITYIDPSPPALGLGYNLIAFFNDSIGYAFGDYFYLKTTNGGNTWVGDTGLGNTGVRDYSFINDTLGYVLGDINGDLFKTTNGGISWTQKSNPFYNTFQIHFFDENNGIGIGTTALLINTTDGGNTWTQSFTEQTTTTLNSLFVLNDSVGIAAGGNSLILRTIVDTTAQTSIEQSEIQKLEFNIFPNPVRDNLFIISNLQTAFSYLIYDIMGKEVRSVVNSLSGKAVVDVGDFNKGVYFVKVITGERVMCQKFIKI